ncbi:MAG: hypothetical protein ACOCUI_00895 [bacterium]
MDESTFVIVKMFQGIIDGVENYLEREDAEHDFELFTGIPYLEYEKRIGQGEDVDSILNNYDGTDIFECNLK